VALAAPAASLRVSALLASGDATAVAASIGESTEGALATAAGTAAIKALGATSNMASSRAAASNERSRSSTTAASLALSPNKGRMKMALVDTVGAGASTSAGPASTGLHSLPRQVRATAGKKNPRMRCPSSQRVRTTAPATNSDNAANAPKIQPGMDLMRSS
jgi:hypothetical protein